MIDPYEIQRGIFSAFPADQVKLTRVGKQMYNPVHFLEKIPFSEEVPYTVRAKSFPENELCPMHYASSIEILLITDCTGTVTIGQHRYSLCGRDCFFIAPNVIHSTEIRKGNGILYGIKISPENISTFINIEAMLSHQKTTYHQIAPVQDCYDNAYRIMCDLVEDDGDMMLGIIHIIALVHLFARTVIPEYETSISPEIQVNSQLNKLIRWTGEHYMEQITVEDAANMLHFSKSYFCRLFKATTKITYLTYLNQVRISQAAYLLQNGKSVAYVSNACGFANVSYFISLFRNFFGCTPGDYVRQFQAAVTRNS